MPLQLLGHDTLRIPLYRIPLLLREDEVDILLNALRYADRPDFTKGNIKIKNKLASLINTVLVEYNIEKSKHKT